MISEVKAKAVLGKLNDRYHDAMQEAQQAWGGGMPLNMLALFFGVQINAVRSQFPGFADMVTAEVKRQANKIPTTSGGGNAS